MHSHAIPSFNYNARTICAGGILSCESGSYGARGGGTDAPNLATYSFSQVSAMVSTAIPIPYVQLIACRVTSSASNNVLPDQNAIFFYDGNTCPPTYRETTARTDGFIYSNIVGRLVWNRYDSVGTPGQTFGGAQFNYALGTNQGTSDFGHAAHTHQINVPSYNFPNAFEAGCMFASSLSMTSAPGFFGK